MTTTDAYLISVARAAASAPYPPPSAIGMVVAAGHPATRVTNATRQKQEKSAIITTGIR